MFVDAGIKNFLTENCSLKTAFTYIICWKGEEEEEKEEDRLFVDTGISGQEAVDVFTWTNAALIRLLQLQEKP